MDDRADAVEVFAFDQDAPVTEPFAERALGHDPLVHAEEEDVGLDLLGVDPDALDLGEAIGQTSRVVQILCEAFYVVLQRIQPSRRDDARLTHAAAEHLTEPVGPLDELGGSQNHGSDRRAEAFGEAE